MKLTLVQEKAVTYRGQNLQLIACAGSGKTEVVAQRVVRLLTPGRRETLLPRNIIAFTFTDKAAAELKERIVTGLARRSAISLAWPRCSSARFTHSASNCSKAKAPSILSMKC